MTWLARQLETNRTEVNGNIRPMEGMRGVAVAMVFAVHYTILLRPWFADRSGVAFALDAIHNAAVCGVDLFFFLSGFLIYGSLISRAQPFFRYMARRLRRIYPTYLVVFLIYVLLSVVYPAENKIPSSLLGATEFLLSNLLLLPGVLPFTSMISVAWSLSYELFFYLAIPILIFLARLRLRRRNARVAILCSVGILGTIAYLALGGPIRLVMFLGGALVWESVDAKATPKLNSAVVLLAFALTVSSFAQDSTSRLEELLKIGGLFLACYLVCVLCLSKKASWLPQKLTATPIRWLGNMSYSYYLLHGLVLKGAVLVLAKVLAPQGRSSLALLFGLLPLLFLATLVFSLVLFVLVERPFSIDRVRPVFQV